MADTSPDLQKPFDDIRREVIESRNMTIKTDNALKTLHAELKAVAQQQADFQKRSWFSSGIAYLGFIGLCVGGVIAITNAKASSASGDRERLEKQLAEVNSQLEKQKGDAAAVAAAEQTAANLYRMMANATGEERLKGADAVAKMDQSKLTVFQKAVLHDKAISLRKELGAGFLEKGKNSFRKQDWNDTVEQLTRFLNVNPGDEDALEASFFLGNAEIQVRKFDDAVKHLSRFIDGDKKAKNRDFAMLLLVQAYDSLGQKDKAVEVTKDALASYGASEFRQQFVYRLQRANAAAAPAAAPAAPAPAAPAPAPVPAAVPAAAPAAAPH